jgi:hypothetical protein
MTPMPEDHINYLDPPFILGHEIKPIACLATKTIVALQNKDSCTLWRSTEHRRKSTTKYDGKLFPTVTFVSIEALIHFLFKYPDWATKDTQGLDINKSIEAILTPEVTSFKSAHDITIGDGVNPFTLARYIHVLIAAENSRLIPSSRDIEFRTKIKTAIELIAKNIDENLSNQWHPFLINHIMRAIKMVVPLFDQTDSFHARLNEIEKSLMERTRKITLNILSQKVFGGIIASDAVALGFCAATLSTSNDKQDLRLILPSLEVCFNSQDSSGCWPQGRVIMDNDDTGAQPLTISTYEIAWVMSDTLWFLGNSRLISLRAPGIQSYIQKLLQTLNYSWESIEHISVEQLAQMTDKEPKDGWCADHKYNLPLIESWTTACVLNFVVSLHELVQVANQQSVIINFPSVDPLIDEWPDWRCWNKYRQENEPEEKVKVLDYLHQKIVFPILENPNKMPSKDAKDISVLLFGPPGTQKTSIVLAISEGLRWPVVMLSPGVFIEKGLEFIEAQASSVFTRLSMLTQTIILFDECDELFRDRKPLEGTEQMREITAFVTASMLPKLQKLHDEGQVLFFICTNQIESMDKAVCRGGRIDHVVGIGPPDQSARLRILRNFVKIDKSRATINSSKIECFIKCLAANTERFNRLELEWAYNLLYPKLENLMLDNIKDEVKSQITILKGSVTITEADFNKFENNKNIYSRPHIEGRRPS